MRHSLVIIIRGSLHEIFSIVKHHPFSHIVRIKNHSLQFPVHFLFSNRQQKRFKVFRGKLRDKFLHRIMMMNPVSKKHFLGIHQKMLKFLCFQISFIIPQDFFQHLPQAKIIPVILVPEDVPSRQCRTTQVINKQFLLQRQTVEHGNIITQYLYIIKLLQKILLLIHFYSVLDSSCPATLNESYIRRTTPRAISSPFLLLETNW